MPAIKCATTTPHPPHRIDAGPFGVKDCPGVGQPVIALRWQLDQVDRLERQAADLTRTLERLTAEHAETVAALTRTEQQRERYAAVIRDIAAALPLPDGIPIEAIAQAVAELDARADATERERDALDRQLADAAALIPDDTPGAVLGSPRRAQEPARCICPVLPQPAAQPATIAAERPAHRDEQSDVDRPDPEPQTAAETAAQSREG